MKLFGDKSYLVIKAIGVRDGMKNVYFTVSLTPPPPPPLTVLVALGCPNKHMFPVDTANIFGLPKF